MRSDLPRHAMPPSRSSHDLPTKSSPVPRRHGAGFHDCSVCTLGYACRCRCQSAAVCLGMGRRAWQRGIRGGRRLLGCGLLCWRAHRLRPGAAAAPRRAAARRRGRPEQRPRRGSGRRGRHLVGGWRIAGQPGACGDAAETCALAARAQVRDLVYQHVDSPSWSLPRDSCLCPRRRRPTYRRALQAPGYVLGNLSEFGGRLPREFFRHGGTWQARRSGKCLRCVRRQNRDIPPGSAIQDHLQLPRRPARLALSDAGPELA
mmetsp:Transcript_101290/g.325533  ORF Transcript_101290/g.325533 Transcript_101290/m.325533 type:complete len:260 (-) Transcript_101290:436-1215(-)